MGLVLCRDSDAPDSGVDAIGKRKIDNAELAGKRQSWFSLVIGELFEAAATAPRQNDRECVP